MAYVEPRRRGRPRDPAKRRSIIDATREIFLKEGADEITVDKVIAHAKVSRATYYSNFAGRHELLAAMIARDSERIAPVASVHLENDKGTREELIAYGDDFIAFLADPDTARMEPLIAHVGQTQPDLASSLFAGGPRRVWNVLAEIIRTGQARGELEAELDPDEAVSNLIGMWRGAWYVEVSYGQRPPLNVEEQRLHSRNVVGVLMRAYGRNDMPKA